MKKPTILDYYRSFGILKGSLSAFVVGLPFFVDRITDKVDSTYIPPPIEPVGLICLIVVGCAALSSTYGFLALQNGKAPRMKAFAVAFVTCCGLYLVLCLRFVARVPDDSGPKPTLHLIVTGYTQTMFAKTKLAGESDVQMLTENGIDEESPKELWTNSSLLVMKLALVLSLCGAFASATAYLSGLVVLDTRSREEALSG